MLAARPAGYPWPEQMDRKKYRKVEISGVPAADLPERFYCSGERCKNSRKHQLSDHRLGLNVARGGWPVPPIRTGLRATWMGHDGFRRVLVSPDNDGLSRKATRRISQLLLEDALYSPISRLLASFFLDTSRSKSLSTRNIGDFRLIGR